MKKTYFDDKVDSLLLALEYTQTSNNQINLNNIANHQDILNYIADKSNPAINTDSKYNNPGFNLDQKLKNALQDGIIRLNSDTNQPELDDRAIDHIESQPRQSSLSQFKNKFFKLNSDQSRSIIQANKQANRQAQTQQNNTNNQKNTSTDADQKRPVGSTTQTIGASMNTKK